MKVYYTSITQKVDVLDGENWVRFTQEFFTPLEVQARYLCKTYKNHSSKDWTPSLFRESHFLFLYDGNEFDAKELILQGIRIFPHDVSSFMSPVDVRKKNDWVTGIRKYIIDEVNVHLSETVDNLSCVDVDAISKGWRLKHGEEVLSNAKTLSGMTFIPVG